MKEYGWKRPGVVDANVVMRELESLGLSTEGITPEQLEEVARSPRSSLHPLLTWDDTEAARNWRIHECSYILRNLVVKVERSGEPIVIRAIVRAAPEDEKKGRYWEVERAMTDNEMARSILNDAVRDAYAMAKKYRELSHYNHILEISADRFQGVGDWITSEIPRLSDENKATVEQTIIAPKSRIKKSDMKRQM